MKLSLIIIIMVLNVVFLTRSASKETHHFFHSRTLREILLKPNKTCNSSKEGHTDYDAANPKRIWICKDSEWLPYKLLTALGTTKQLSGQSCKQIKKDSSEAPPKSGIYWLHGMQVYCEMNALDGGGWTLVWQHSYMETVPLTTNMTYFGDYYKPCTQHATGWCNIPNKARFNPTEQMIVAYLNKRMIYAYKAVFNRNIDYDWTGRVLIDCRKVTDSCTYGSSYCPQPVKTSYIYLLGIAFGKTSSSYRYYGGGTISGTLTRPIDDRWRYCRNNVKSSNEQMTLAIYVR